MEARLSLEVRGEVRGAVQRDGAAPAVYVQGGVRDAQVAEEELPQ